VSDTRLPAAAKHRAIRAINAAHTRYAIGAAEPSRSATVAGIKKIDDAIVTLMMLAVSWRVPIALTSFASAELADISGHRLARFHSPAAHV
jgi:hypothetical protein